MKTIQHLIDAASVHSTSGRTSGVYNPATGQQTAALSLASGDDVDMAVASAQKAFETWSTVSLAGRTKLLYNFRNLIDQVVTPVEPQLATLSFADAEKAFARGADPSG